MLVNNAPIPLVLTHETAAILEKWMELKDTERKAAEMRRELEAILIDRFSAPAGSSKTHRYEHFRIKTSKPLSFKASGEKLVEYETALEIPIHLTKLEPSESGLKALRKEHQDYFDLLVSDGVLEVKEGKTTFDIVTE